MDEIARICEGIKITRPSIDFEQLLALESPSAEFEAHVPAEVGKDAWIYTVGGKTVNGEVMVVRARTPLEAETMAQEGLRDTIAALHRFNANTGIQAEVEVRPVQ